MENRRYRRWPATLVVVGVLAAALPATGRLRAQEAPQAEVAAELQGIRTELRSIVELLASVEEQQRLAVLMTRIELKQRRLSSIEGELRSARDERESAEQEVARLTAIEESFGRDSLREEELSEDDRRAVEMMRLEKRRLADRVETLRLRINELENDVAVAEEDVRALEEAVDERLGLR